MNNQESKPEKGVYVIMPFTNTPSRNQEQLKNFFNENLKKVIEAEANLKYRYKVWKSGEAFAITDQIIRDLFEADIVIADISGKYPNPNVMYELGARLALSNKPVILIREKNLNIKRPFDIQGFYAKEFDSSNYEALENHLIDKLRDFETGTETFESPVIKALYDIELKFHSVRDQRKILKKFCSRVQGAWWQLIIEKNREDDKITEFSISFVRFVPDEVTNEIRMYGRTYNEVGRPKGYWESLAVGIVASERKILYYWKARLSSSRGSESKGYGEFEFDPSNDMFNHGGGQFMNTLISDSPTSWRKKVELRRISEEQHIYIMTNGDDRKKQELAMKILKKMKENATSY